MAVEAVKDELNLLSLSCDIIWNVLCDKTKKLGEHLENIAALQHIVFVCYRQNRTKFLPSQNYLTYNITFGVYIDSGDRLEEAYGLLRCLAGGATGNGSGMDVLQCTERISGVMAVQGGVDQCQVNINGMSLKYKYITGRSIAKKALADAGFSSDDVNWNAIVKENNIASVMLNGSFIGTSKQEDDKDCDAPI
eukprot:12248961-Ditylum_brightwellii.AAC.1